MDSKKPFSIRIKSSSKTLAKKLVSFLAAWIPVLRRENKRYDALKHAQLQKDLDKKLVYSLSKSRFPTWRQFKYIGRYLSRTEKRIINICLFLLVASLVFMGGRFYLTNLELVPVQGGDYSEALVGVPQLINPLYAGRNDVDDDISQLVFSSLFKRGINSELQKDLVSDFFVSTDNKVYEIQIRQDVKWHDGSALTANDIVFTFNAIKDPIYKSSLRDSFNGVSIEQVDDYNIKFLLSEPYAAFLDLLTFQVLPAEYWVPVQPESATLASLNLKPIGSGPYKFDSLIRDNAGNVKEYKLSINQDYYDKRPFINLSFRFYNNFDEAIVALNDNTVDGISYLPADLRQQLVTPKSYHFHKILFPQITLLFFNQQANPALADKAIRQALAYAIDRRAIVNDVLDGDAYLVDSPILANSFAYNPDVHKYIYNKDEAVRLLESVDWKLEEVNDEMLEKAQADLESDDEDLKLAAAKIVTVGKGKWRKKDGDYLVIRLSTVERKENSEIVEAISDYWEEIGVKVITEVVPATRIGAEVIRPRDYEALFYAQVLGSDPDPYAFWHSSQAENGFNIANYKNKEVDKLLEEARLTVEINERQERYRQFQEIITEELPAIFMYSPHYTYVQDNSIKGFDVQNILVPKDRFANVADWYIKTGRKLKFNKDNNN